MLNMHYLRYLPIFVLFVCGMLQLCGADRGSKFSQGPDIRSSWKGQMCILREDHAEAGEFTYDHVDESGNSCKCDLCPRGKILHRACVCDPNSSGYLEPSDCRLVNVGEQMMPDRNNCTKGFDCRKCNHPWVVEVQCGLHGTDTVCKCGDGYYRASEEQCKPDPHCDKGFERIITEDVLNGTYVTGNATGPTVHPTDQWHLFFWSSVVIGIFIVGVVTGVVSTLVCSKYIYAYLLNNFPWFREHFGTENQRGDDNAGEAPQHVRINMDNINEDNENAVLVDIGQHGNKAVDQCSRDGSPDMLQMNPDDHSAPKAKQEQGPKRQRNPSSSSKNSGSSEDLVSLIYLN
ncbi:uncharacterized protein LOC119744311 [Patiria miniata]|uniref:EGF-like domain-containing protein n=1 Tax=Patiria miniata TaxID=46514 RepID=A0A914BIJ2_PATMI|nr:uncharacterized protein LOC119744311 [Patiria miniata]